jgi:phage-related minor tail protein
METVMAQCYSTIKDSDIDHMFAQAPEVIQQVRTNGAVTDELLDRLGIVKLPNGAHINRDKLVTWRQHAHVMSHVNSKAKFVNYLQMRADKNNPVLQLQLKQQELAAKIIARETVAREKAAAVIREREIKTTEREAEKLRRRGLTPAETRAEIIERKAETARKKNARAQESADRLQAAMAVVDGDFIPDDIEGNFDDENNFDRENNVENENHINDQDDIDAHEYGI